MAHLAGQREIVRESSLRTRKHTAHDHDCSQIQAGKTDASARFKIAEKVAWQHRMMSMLSRFWRTTQTQ